MKTETLLKANEIQYNINRCNINLSRIEYTQNEDVAIRETRLNINGVNEEVVVPKKLFRVIGKLIQSEYIQELSKLEKELEGL